MEITSDMLRAVAPNAKDEVLEAFAEAMTNNFEDYEMTPLRAAHFIAQAAHESTGFTRFTENLNYRAQRLMQVFPKYFRDVDPDDYAGNPEAIANRVYGGRMGNGPESSGDGWKYRGRGIFQLTGKSNYKTIGDAIEVDLIDDPDAALSSDNAVLIALEYWDQRNINDAADEDDVVGVTRKINGGTIGLEERKLLLKKAKRALGV